MLRTSWRYLQKVGRRCHQLMFKQNQLRRKLSFVYVLLFTTAFLLTTIGLGWLTPLQAQVSQELKVETLKIESLNQSSNPQLATPSDPQTLVQQGKTFYEKGQFVEAIKLLQQAADAFQAQGDTQRQAIALSNLSLAHQQMGQWSEAEKAVSSSLQLLQNGTSKEQLKLRGAGLDIQGQLYLAQGQLTAALENFSAATAVYTQVGDQAGITHSKINQAQALQASGFYRRALDTLQEVNLTLQQQPDSQLKATGLRSLGITLRLVGNFDESQKVLEQSLAVAQLIQSPQEISATLLSLGNIAKVKANIKAALNYYQQAADISTVLTTQIQARLNQLSLLVETDEPLVADELAQKVQAQIAYLSPSRAAVDARINLVRSLMKLGKVHGAGEVLTKDMNQLLTEAVQQAKSLQDTRAEAYALGQLGTLYEQNQQLKAAQDYTSQALLLAQSINAPDIAYRWQWQLGRLLKAQKNTQGAIEAYTSAVSTLESLRSDLVSINPDVQFSFRESVEPVYRQLVGLLLESKDNNFNQKNLAQARSVIESLQLAELVNFFRENCVNGTPIQIDEVDKRAAVIYPIVLEDRLEVVLSLPGNPLRHYATPLPKDEVEKVFTQLREVVAPYTTDPNRSIISVQPRDRPPNPQQYFPLSQKVYDWLIRPAEQDIAASDIKTLVFVLDGPLLNLPMAALYDGQQFLIEKYAIALTPGLQLLDPKPLARGKLTALKAGLSEARGGFPPLPNVKRELEKIKLEVPGDVLLDQAFTKLAIQKEVDSVPFPVVHLATHGQFSSKAEDTFIVTWDGYLNVNQLSNLLRSREEKEGKAIELLVLSACQTATGDERAALGLAGVAVRAGARSTLATLWFVDDAATAELMIRFYQELANPAITKAEALRRAQVALLQNSQYQQPVYWAPFVLVGNWL